MWELAKIIVSGLCAVIVEVTVVQIHPNLDAVWLVTIGIGVWAAIWLLLSLVTQKGM